MLQRVGLLTAGTLAALVLSELGLGLLAPQVMMTPRVWHFDADTGWANLPGARGRLVSPEFNVEFAINGEGLRGPETTLEKPAGVRRVAIFGDSFAQGWGVDEADTLRARLAARLRERSRAPIEVLNFGVAGYGSDQSLLAFRKVGRRFDPDVVVLVVYGNDLADNTSDFGNGGGGRLVPKPRFTLAPDRRLRTVGVPVEPIASWDSPHFASAAWFARVGADLVRRSHVKTLVSRAWKSADLWQTAAYYERIYARQPSAATREAWVVTEAVITAFDEEARTAGARFILLYASDAIEVDGASWDLARETAGFGDALDAGHPSQELARIARAHEIAFVDLRPLLRSEAQRGPFFFQERHWNAAGHALAADALAAVIVP